MFASAPLTRPASALQLDSDIDNSRGIINILTVHHDLIIVYYSYFDIIIRFSLSMLETKDAWCFRVSVSCKFIFTINVNANTLVCLWRYIWDNDNELLWISFCKELFITNLYRQRDVLFVCARKMSCIAKEPDVNLSYDLAPDYKRLC